MMKKRKILIVDDQEINRKILSKMLANQYEILSAENGREALEVLTENKDISAVLLDIVMPVMNGYEVLEEMNSDTKLSKIPVIVSSQKDGDEAEVKALSLGAYDFIAKPYKADIIRHRLENTINLRETAAMVNRAEKDELTGLYNKQFFCEKVREELELSSDTQYEILCLGVERFKLINDTYGEETGNHVLCHIAKVMKHVLNGATVIGRFSADEYYAMIPQSQQDNDGKMRECSRRINEYPIDMEIKIHAGIYNIQGDEKSVNACCDRAKLAADANRGIFDKSYTVYDDSLRQHLLDEQFIIGNMNNALSEHQFHVYYQPKYALEKEAIAGAEALVRWIHPEKGFMSPGAFIPLFEKNGFIKQLDRYVWETVCRDIRDWLDEGYPQIAVSVNVSRADIFDPTLTDTLLMLTEKYRIPRHLLHLEITESAYTQNPDQIISVVKRFRELGFIIEMDDFGSGYSSLNTLAQMPVDILKLDMKFVQTETQNTSGKGIMSFVISLAKWLDLSVVAEGTETKEQVDSLRSMACDYAQGFYYARPMPLDEFKKLLRKVPTTTMERELNLKSIKDEFTEDPFISADRMILIVDDIKMDRKILAEMFIGTCAVAEAANGQEAWEILEQHYEKVDAVLLDLIMPVMDGFQLLKKIRNDERMKNIPVMITSQGDQESEERALKLEADDFISKPFRIDLIRHRIHNIIELYRLRKEIQK